MKTTYTTQLKNYAYLMRFHRPIGIFLLLWPTLWALWLAGGGKPDPVILTIFILGVIVMRSAGCIINDFADRNLDKWVARTKERPLAKGTVSVKEGLVLFAILIAIGVLLAMLLNIFTFLLAVIGASLVAGYPFLKRVTYLPQVGLGIAFSWGVPMAFAAELNHIPGKAWVLFIAAAVWPVIYDTYYAMVDREDDVKVGIKSTAILFGSSDTFVIGMLQSLFLLLLVVVGLFFELNLPYFISLFFVAILFIHQQAITYQRDPASCYKAFLNNHWVGLIIFMGIVMGT